MRVAMIAGLVCLSLAGGVALADPPPASNGAVADTPPNPDDRIYCIRQPAPTGSHLGDSKECHTAAQWRQIHTYGADAVNRAMQDQESHGLQGGGVQGH